MDAELAAITQAGRPIGFEWSNLSQPRLICVKPAVAIGRTLATMAAIDWIYVLSVGTLALSIGAMCILLFAI